MKKSEPFTHLPPGVPLNKIRRLFRIGEVCAFLWSTGFLVNYSSYRKSCLWDLKMGQEAVMPSFAALMAEYPVMRGFLILAICMLGLVPVFYASYYQESKSIYLMRRLPDRWLIHRQCWTLPVRFAALALFSIPVLTLVYYVIYLLLTPAVLLPV